MRAHLYRQLHTLSSRPYPSDTGRGGQGRVQPPGNSLGPVCFQDVILGKAQTALGLNSGYKQVCWPYMESVFRDDA
jgi:hypothetical protein